MDNAPTQPQVGTPEGQAPEGNVVATHILTTPAPHQAPQAGDPQTQTQTPQTTPISGQEPEIPEALKPYIKQLRDEAASNRTKAKAAADELARKNKEIADAKLTDEERTKQQLADYQAKDATWQRERQELVTDHALERMAWSYGAEKPEGVRKLADLSRLEYDEAGAPTEESLRAVVEAVKVDYPGVFKAQNAPPSAGGAINPPKQGAPISKSWLQNASDEEFDRALKDGSLSRAMSSGAFRK